MKPPSAAESVLGQYDGYVQHVREDVARWSSAEDLAAHDETPDTRTPTFAAAELFINNDRWAGVPFLVLAGKQLKQREAYVRVSFKNGAQLLFQVQGDGTYIEASGDLPSFTALPYVLQLSPWKNYCCLLFLRGSYAIRCRSTLCDRPLFAI